MRRIALSSSGARISCVVGDVLFCGFAALWLRLSFRWWALLLVLLALAMLALYNIQLFRSAVLVDRSARTLRLSGLQNRTDDVSAARLVSTRLIPSGRQMVRAVVLTDETGADVCVLTPMAGGSGEEPCLTIASRLAQVLGLELHLPGAAQDCSAVPSSSASGPAKETSVNYDEADDGPSDSV